MPEPCANTYDLIVYGSSSIPSTHPDRLATMATLLGTSPAPVARCRVLELGCATGGNLLPLAESLPNSQLVGVDLSARQIDVGRQIVDALQLNNLRLEARSILDIDPAFGTFDYNLAADGEAEAERRGWRLWRGGGFAAVLLCVVAGAWQWRRSERIAEEPRRTEKR